MIFDKTSQHGIKKQFIPPPRVVDIHKYASYDDVLKIDHDLFFTDETDDLSRYVLCGTSGVPFEITDKDDWFLCDFLKVMAISLANFDFMFYFCNKR